MIYLMNKQKTKRKTKSKQLAVIPGSEDLVDLDKIGKVTKLEVTVNGKPLALKIGDKLMFPAGDPILKTISAIQINENDIESYLLEWYEPEGFKQYWISMTELKLLRENLKQHALIGLYQQQQNVDHDE